MTFYRSFVVVVLCFVKFSSAMETVTVETMIGKIKGYARTIEPFGKPLRVRQFLGVPYAEPPVGSLRFQKPVMKQKMEGVYDATNYKPACFQLYIDFFGERKDESHQFSSNCLVLNIYTPDDLGPSVKVPVMILIHGGGFVFGLSNIYDGHITSAYGNVVMVTVNYRLGLFGFLSTGDSNLPGNYGLWDQHMAIRWVHENIAAFGGDPEQVTILGGSAGGASVIFQAMYPGNEGLFKRIIPQSGSITCPWAYQRDSLENAKRIANIVGCSTDVDSSRLASCLREISDETYLNAINDPANNYIRFPMEFVVSVDGEFVPLSTWDMLHSEADIAKERRKFFRSLDVMTGLAEDEGFLMISPFVGVDNTDTFSTNRSHFDNVLVPEIIRVMYGENIPDSIKNIVVSEYTNWSDPENSENTYDSFMRLSSDYVFNSQTIDITKIHATKDEDNGNTYLYIFNAPSSQQLLWVPSTWKRGSVHYDEWSFILGYDSDTGYTRSTSPYGQMPEDWEIEMSKVVISIWTNFAKSGDPNKPENIPIEWPKYELGNQLYLNISRDMSVGQRLFERGYNFWTNVLPALIKMTKPDNLIEKNLYCDKNGDCPP